MVKVLCLALEWRQWPKQSPCTHETYILEREENSSQKKIVLIAITNIAPY